MKYNYKLLLTVGAAFALMTPMSAIAGNGHGNGNGNGNGNENDNGKAKGKDKKHSNNGSNGNHANATSLTASQGKSAASFKNDQVQNVSHAATVNVESNGNGKNQGHHHGSANQVNEAQVNTARVSSAQVSRNAANVQQPYYNTANQQRYSTTQQRYNNNTQQQPYYNQNYNRNNNYGGYWYPSNSHPNWNHNNQYQYNNQNYRWYDGGWLIITPAFTPQYSYYNGYYSNGGSMVARVQAQLANQGYYHGAIDGDFGPGTSNAVAGYQQDHGLYVTGRINNALLQSLQVQ